MSRPLNEESERATAERLSLALGGPVTRSMIRVWRGKGYPLDDVPALRHKLRNQSRMPFPISQDPGEIYIAAAGRREADVLVALVHFADEIAKNSTAQQVADAIAFAAVNVYAEFYGVHLGNSDELVTQLIPRQDRESGKCS
jgi:hypothetical protein